ncbi:uncharacterized protein KGF55_003889 [Candida pseudojiufengensis]|uniref:uncharacterized protein n=1 Tax=Candida pseudojiufengensis TaxID=497109 RepID=UPI0022255CAC|nr:uncharacterized protein KGF55_003889 [Candida pseudojiufengensis]KAI5961918.1 hypothetical protein KGF55_003889 [Candida pseudojiufengensis]
MQNNNENVLKFKKLTKEDISKRDIFGRTILHITILLNDHEYFSNVLIKNSNLKSILSCCDYENGWNCLHYIIHYKRLACFNILIEYLNSINLTNNLFSSNGIFVELLKCKDRCGLTPLQLMDNDFKNLRWIPEYININDTYEFTYRFIDSKLNEIDEKEDASKIISMKSPLINWDEFRGGSDIYVIGCNSNNQLGLGDSKDRSVPINVSNESFVQDQDDSESINDRLQRPRFKAMAISKYHSIVLTHDRQVYSCGVGSRGRLGHGDNSSSTFKYKRIEFFNELSDSQYIRQVAISNNHTVILTSNNEIYAWGSNSFNQLGVSSPASNKKSNNYLDDFIPTPTLVMGEIRKHRDEKLLGIAVSKIHTVSWSKNKLFFWGLNAGQMGLQCVNGDVEIKLHDQMVVGEIQPSPKLVSLRDEIKLVSTSELCTCVVTIFNDIHVFHNFQHYKLPKIPIKGLGDKYFDLFKPPKLTQAAIIEKIVTRGSDVTMILLSNGSIMSFNVDCSDIKQTKYNVVWKAHNDHMVAIDFDCGSDGSVILCTKDGSVFLKTSQSSTQRKNSMSAATLPIPVNNKNKFKKLENLNKIVKVTCDSKFLSFGFIRDDIDLLPVELNKNEFWVDFKHLAPIGENVNNRKQEQLMKTTKVSENRTYITSFFDESLKVAEDDYPRDSNKPAIDTTIEDRLNEIYHRQKFKSIHWSERYVPVYDKSLEEMLKSDESYLLHEFCSYNKNNDDIKFYDGCIKFQNEPGSVIGFHIDVLAHFSPVFKSIVNSSNNIIVGKSFEAEWMPESSTLMVKSQTRAFSLLLILQSIYLDKKIDLQVVYGSRSKVPEDLKIVQTEYDEIVDLFNLKLSQNNLVGLSVNLLDSEGDVIFKLKDGKLFAHSYILRTRSAFFETILSERWDTGITTLDFSGISTTQMQIILRHVYGADDSTILNSLDYKFEENDLFVNEILEMIEIADELLMFDLKSILEVAVIGFITLENVLVLLTHADYLSASKLFLNCCWCIYNNLEVLMFNPSFIAIPKDVLQKLETNVLILDRCKFYEKKDEKWIESHVKVEEFVEDIDKFNNYFMSDGKGFASFEPLVDSKLEVKKTKESVPKKKKSRKSSTLNSDIIDFRANWAKSNNNGGTGTSSSIKESSVAVEEESSDTGFITVGKRSRKPKHIELSQDDLQSLKPKQDFKSKPIPNSINPATTIKSPSLNGLSPQSTWASPDSFIASASGSKAFTPEPPTSFETKLSESKQFKPKMGPHIKLSQKERKKIAAAAALNEANKDTNTTPEIGNQNSDIAPWSSITNPSPTSNSIASKFPALGLKKNKSSVAINNTHPSSSSTNETKFTTYQINSSSSSLSSMKSATPSLTEIMLNETLQKEQAREENLTRKSLSEIQKEQEFERWWQEESKKVQMEMGSMNITNGKKSKNQKNGNGSFRKSSSPKSQNTRDKNSKNAMKKIIT